MSWVCSLFKDSAKVVSHWCGSICQHLLCSTATFNFKHVLKAFESRLTQRVEQLKLKKVDDCFISFSWMQQALEALCGTHKDMLNLIHHLDFEWHEEEVLWSEYMDATHKIMTLCEAMKKDISRHEVVPSLVNSTVREEDFMPHVLRFNEGPQEDVGSSSGSDVDDDNDDEEEEIERCAETLEGLSRSLSFSFSLRRLDCNIKETVFLRAMYGVRIMSSFVCGILASALSGSPHLFTHLQVSAKLSWGNSFMRLQQEVHKEIGERFERDRFVVKELEDLDRTLENIFKPRKSNETEEGLNKTEHIKHGFQELGQIGESISKSLNGLRNKVDELYWVVFDGRVVLMEALQRFIASHQP